jgi:hypothetical protein
MGRTFGTYGRRERCIKRFSWGNVRERDHWEDLGVDGKIILRLISRSGMGGTDWIDMT